MYISLFAVAIPVNYTTEFHELFEVTKYVQIQRTVNQECTNPGRQVAMATKFFLRLIFLGPQYGICFISYFWRLRV